MMNKTLLGKVVLVTGGGSGIGRAAAVAFAQVGARIMVAGRNAERLKQTVELINACGSEAGYVMADVTQARQVEDMVRHCVMKFGRLDCAFNNAGIEGDVANTVDCSETNWDRVMATNLKGVWLCMKYEITQMLKQGGGIIVNNSSDDGLVGAPEAPAYCASKHGVVGLTRAAALEFALQGIRVNAVCPGWVDTDMTIRFTKNSPELEHSVHARHPIGRMGKPEEVAQVVVWLCSQAASYITGHALAVDGGFTAA
jgi:NAD(P)-dependent dehydrogenase (short-subunit alcohol dehydrogenase family)